MKKNKSRIILTGLAVLCAAALAAGVYFRDGAVAVIGGADGPTAIYIAGKVGADPFFTAAAILAGSALGYYFVARKKNKR